MNRLYGPLASLLMISLITSGCGGSAKQSGGQNSSAKYATTGTFTMSIDDDWGGFDPYQNRLFGYTYLAYDPLVFLKPDGRLVPGLAEKWSADASSATFTIRPNITCSDGSPLTASDVAAAITYVADAKSQSIARGWTVPDVPLKATADDGSRTVKVVVDKPFGMLLNMIGQFPIVCAKGMRDRASLKTSSAGTGPFVLKQVVPGQSYTFEVRKGYTWGPDGAGTSAPGTPAKVVLRVVANVTTRANLLLTGQLNMGSVVGTDRQRLEARGLKRVNMPISGNWLWINQRSYRPTADKRVRQALVQALDLAEVTKVSTGGYGSAATGMVSMKPNPCPGDNISGQLPGHDPANAASLLDQADWIKGSDGLRRKNGKKLTIDVHYVASVSEYNKTMAELLNARWGALGITVKLVSDTFLSATKSVFDVANFDIYTTGFGFNDASQAMKYVDGPPPPQGSNLTGIKNKDYETLANKALTMTLPAACTYWNQAEQALYRDLNLVPISDRPVTFYLNKAEAQNTGQYVPVIPTSLRVFK